MEEALIKRVLPHSPEAEQSVIASMLLEKDAIVQDISAKLTQLKQSIDSLNQELS